MVVVAAVHGARAPPRLPGTVLLDRHRPEDREHLLSRRARLGERAVDRHAVDIGEAADGCDSFQEVAACALRTWTAHGPGPMSRYTAWWTRDP